MNRQTISYGEHAEQFGHLYLPEKPVSEPVPVVVVIHGGFWHGRYALNLGTQYAIEFARAGFAAWNIEYRRVGAGGLWPEVRQDVVDALEAVATVVQQRSALALDTDDVRVLGHSAGGHLAGWLAGCRDLAVRPSRVVTQAGVLDLVAGPATGAVNPAVRDLLGVSFEDDPELYRAASPLYRVPTGVPVHCIHGALDVQVPVALSERYVAAAVDAGDDASLSVVEGEDHFDFLRPGSVCWQQSIAATTAPPAG
ncbi:prolyl oligopeptidase family serine peptidase [Rhodococcoides kyotonense]|uniref:Prolyl oligopeptidase family protein n=1 Tax=Rhodococcoides kyotonense TaxID=398843 RepID=A0A239HJ26_9NOCA|nr:prolyl oligopeptidase family serine peptidase [Rhodococcus kyotonensis]SNS81409.1 Prolyl oligopeptidase family protein [Rhodococcus kyotonensis]